MKRGVIAIAACRWWMGIAAGLLFSGAAMAASPPCSLTPLWQFQDDSAYITGGGVSDSAGNVYLIGFTFDYPGSEGVYVLISLDQNGRLRFRTQLVPDQDNFDNPELAIIGANVVVRVHTLISLSAPAGQVTLFAVRTEDGSLAWSRNMNADLQVPLHRLHAGTPGQEDGKVAVPVVTVDDSWAGEGALVAEYDSASGELVRVLQSPYLVGLTLVVDEQNNLYLGGGGLSSWNSAGVLRHAERNAGFSDLIATASGFVVAGSHPHSTEQPFQVLRSNGVLLASTPHPFLSPLISGSRFSYVECTGYSDGCTTASLATMDLGTNRLLWRAFLGESVRIVNPILTTARSVVLLQGTLNWPEQAAIREFDSAGNEYVTCTIPSLENESYDGFTIAGNRFLAFGWKTVLGFDSYNHKPAAKGWVMQGGGPEGQRRPR